MTRASATRACSWPRSARQATTAAATAAAVDASAVVQRRTSRGGAPLTLRGHGRIVTQPGPGRGAVCTRSGPSPARAAGAGPPTPRAPTASPTRPSMSVSPYAANGRLAASATPTTIAVTEAQPGRLRVVAGRGPDRDEEDRERHQRDEVAERAQVVERGQHRGVRRAVVGQPQCGRAGGHARRQADGDVDGRRHPGGRGEQPVRRRRAADPGGQHRGEGEEEDDPEDLDEAAGQGLRQAGLGVEGDDLALGRGDRRFGGCRDREAGRDEHDAGDAEGGADAGGAASSGARGVDGGERSWELPSERGAGLRSWVHGPAGDRPGHEPSSRPDREIRPGSGGGQRTSTPLPERDAAGDLLRGVLGLSGSTRRRRG